MRLTHKQYLSNYEEWRASDGTKVWRKYTAYNGKEVLECLAPSNMSVEEIPDTDFDELWYDWDCHLYDITSVSNLRYGRKNRTLGVAKIDGHFLCRAGCFQGDFTEFCQAVLKKYSDDPVLGAEYIYGMYSLIESFERQDEPREQYYMDKLKETHNETN